jgi:integrase/recombinase XerD
MQEAIQRSWCPPTLLADLAEKQGIDDALIQPYSGHASRKSSEIYSQLAIGEAQLAYDGVMPGFPV